MVLRSLGGSQAQCSRGLLICPLGIVLPLMELGHTLQGTPQRAGVAWLLGQRHGASFHCSQRYSVGYNTIPGMSTPPYASWLVTAANASAMACSKTS
jgi:hypothetical protein